MCGFRWAGRESFLSDPRVKIIGYQACLNELKAGCLLFNHACEGTFAVRVREFEDLYEGPVFEERKTGTDACPGYCLRQEELRRCAVQCECAFAREIVQIVEQWPKDPSVLR